MNANLLPIDDLEPTLQLAIEREKGKFFVLLIDNVEINQVGPLTKKQALKLHYELALAAIRSGGHTQPIRKPKIKSASANRQANGKPVRNYPISQALLDYISS